MAEVAGLVLGAIPLILSSLKHQDELSEYTLAFFRWRKAKSLMIRQLALCQVDFELNMRLLLKNAVSPEKHFQMIENPQDGSWNDGEFLKNIEQKLGKSYSILISILRDIENSMVWIVSSLDIAGPDELAQKGLRAIIQEHDLVAQTVLPRRTLKLQMRAKFTWSRRKVKAEMKKLEDCNAKLSRILMASNQLTESAPTTNNMTVNFVGPLEEISRNASRVHDALSNSCLQDLLPDIKNQSFALSDFYRLAITLASSCIQLRSTRWLHQSWNKQSILFLRPNPDRGASADMRYPYLTMQSQPGGYVN
ncbi:hypothetical protein FGADI_9192 [Fusarium gaditjirri]|uniref:Uncharacterized protein n=1 Tax=Fusarium gaditjirri TaxID=282569 RepID=A0A8H4T0C4_9HYPO|nr:hypothetical protein FGADI_9192 [Fusarium gaditjirri]